MTLLMTKPIMIGKAQFKRIPKIKNSKRYKTTLGTYINAVVDLPMDYEPFEGMKCKDNLIKLIRLIECRSLNHQGETKYWTARMAKDLHVTKRTIYNYLNLLEKHGYISRLTDNRLGTKNHFYSIRVIRCNRVVLMKNMRVLKGQIFKDDIRPETTASGFYGNTPVPYLRQSVNLSRIDLAIAGKYDMTVDKMYREIKELAEFGDRESIFFLGKPPLTDNRGAAYIQ
jgi:hypothetical protein